VSARTVGFQQQINKLYMVGVSVPEISVNQASALNEWSERKEKKKLHLKLSLHPSLFYFFIDVYPLKESN
jgi:hypothetical protein